MHDFELGLFKCTFLECKHNASDKQYLDRYHWIDIELDPFIVQYPKPIKGLIKSIHPPSPDIMTYNSQKTNATKSELLKMVEEKFDSNVYFVCIDDNNKLYLIMCFNLLCFHYTSAYQVDNLSSVMRGFVLEIEGWFNIYNYFLLIRVMLYTDM